MSTSTAELRRIATRYGAALFALASEQKQLDGVLRDLVVVAEAWKLSVFRRLLSSPISGREELSEIVTALLLAMDANKLTVKFFQTLAKNRRLDVTPFAAEHFMKLLAEARNEVTAHVTTATPLTPKQEAALQQAIKKATGRSAVHVVTKEDPEILGGVIVQVDGKTLDNSVASKIERLASAMKSAARAS